MGAVPPRSWLRAVWLGQVPGAARGRERGLCTLLHAVAQTVPATGSEPRLQESTFWKWVQMGKSPQRIQGPDPSAESWVREPWLRSPLSCETGSK